MPQKSVCQLVTQLVNNRKEMLRQGDSQHPGHPLTSGPVCTSLQAYVCAYLSHLCWPGTRLLPSRPYLFSVYTHLVADLT